MLTPSPYPRSAALHSPGKHSFLICVGVILSGDIFWVTDVSAVPHSLWVKVMSGAGLASPDTQVTTYSCPATQVTVLPASGVSWSTLGGTSEKGCRVSHYCEVDVAVLAKSSRDETVPRAQSGEAWEIGPLGLRKEGGWSPGWWVPEGSLSPIPRMERITLGDTSSGPISERPTWHSYSASSLRSQVSIRRWNSPGDGALTVRAPASASGSRPQALVSHL